jgi:hypothetical protein
MPRTKVSVPDVAEVAPGLWSNAILAGDMQAEHHNEQQTDAAGDCHLGNFRHRSETSASSSSRASIREISSIGLSWSIRFKIELRKVHGRKWRQVG